MSETRDYLEGIDRLVEEKARMAERIAYLEMENKLLFEHIKGDESDLKRFNSALEKALQSK